MTEKNIQALDLSRNELKKDPVQRRNHVSQTYEQLLSDSSAFQQTYAGEAAGRTTENMSQSVRSMGFKNNKIRNYNA